MVPSDANGTNDGTPPATECAFWPLSNSRRTTARHFWLASPASCRPITKPLTALMHHFINTIILVRDIPVSRDFYTRVMGLTVEREYDTVVFFRDHFVIHNAESLLSNAYASPQKPEAPLGRANLEIYFETDDLAASVARVRASGTKIVHDIVEQPWGQKVFRFLDPDGHLVEIGERMSQP